MYPAVLYRILTVLFALLWAGGCGTHSARSSRTDADTDDTATERRVVALGRLEPAGGIVAVHGKIGDVLAKLNVALGDDVESAGDSLGILSSAEFTSVELASLRKQQAAALNQAAANLAVSEARHKQASAALSAARLERLQANELADKIKLLRENAELAKREYDRLARLAEEDPEITSPQELARFKLAWQKEAAEVGEAEAAHRSAVDVGDVKVEAAQADLQAAEAGILQAQASGMAEVLGAQISAAELNRKWANLPAPIAGKVLRIFVRSGEVLGASPVLQMADLTQMACIAEVYEADAKFVKPNDQVLLKSAAFAGPPGDKGIRGTVTKVGQLVQIPGLMPRDPLSRADRHVIEVRIEIDSRDLSGTTAAAALVGLQVKVEFD